MSTACTIGLSRHCTASTMYGRTCRAWNLGVVPLLSPSVSALRCLYLWRPFILGKLNQGSSAKSPRWRPSVPLRRALKRSRPLAPKTSVNGGFRVEGWGVRGRLFNTMVLRCALCKFHPQKAAMVSTTLQKVSAFFVQLRSIAYGSHHLWDAAGDSREKI